MQVDARWLLSFLLIWSAHATESWGARYNERLVTSEEVAAHLKKLTGEDIPSRPPKPGVVERYDDAGKPLPSRIDSFSGTRGSVPETEAERAEKERRIEEERSKTPEQKKMEAIPKPGDPETLDTVPFKIEIWYDENQTQHTQRPGSARYVPPPKHDEVIPDVTRADLANIDASGGVRERSYPLGKIVQQKWDSNYAAYRALKKHREDVLAKAKSLLGKLRTREVVVTKQTDEIQDLRQNFTAERSETKVQDRNQLRRHYEDVRTELTTEQSAYRRKLHDEGPKGPEVPGIPFVATDCAKLHVGLTTAATDVRVPHLIPGCAKFEKAYQEYREKQAKMNTERNRRAKEERRELNKLNGARLDEAFINGEKADGDEPAD